MDKTILRSIDDKNSELPEFVFEDDRDINIIKSPFQGRILEIKTSINQLVQKGETVVILEAMKMEIAVHSVKTGHVSKIFKNVGDVVKKNENLLLIDD